MTTTACGSGTSVTSTNAGESLDRASTAGSPQEVDLESSVRNVGNCDEIPGAVVDLRIRPGALAGEAETLDWSVAVGPFDVRDAAQGVASSLAMNSPVDLNVVAAKEGPERISSTIKLSGSAVPERFALSNLIGRYWPDDGVVLIGHEGTRVDRAIALHSNGIAIIGYCMGQVSDTWNSGIEPLGIGSIEALDLLFADPSDERFEAALGFAPAEPPEEVVEWADIPPARRTYGSAPYDVLQRLDTVSVTVLVPKEWMDTDSGLGGICSRTPEAEHECIGFSVASQLSNGDLGWQRHVFAVPGESVTLILTDGAERSVAVATLSSDLISPISTRYSGEASGMSVFVDLRPLADHASSPDDVLELADPSRHVSLVVGATLPIVASAVGGEGD